MFFEGTTSIVANQVYQCLELKGLSKPITFVCALKYCNPLELVGIPAVGAKGWQGKLDSTGHGLDSRASPYSPQADYCHLLLISQSIWRTRLLMGHLGAIHCTLTATATHTAVHHTRY